MLYDTLSHPKLFLVFAIAGIACSLFFLLTKRLQKICRNKFLCHILDFFCILFIFFALFLTNLQFHYGAFRVFPIFIFFAFFFLGLFLFEKIFAKLFTKCYTLLKGRRNGKNKS